MQKKMLDIPQMWPIMLTETKGMGGRWPRESEHPLFTCRKISQKIQGSHGSELGNFGKINLPGWIHFPFWVY